ncbi:MAG: site-specific integrase [Gammaproteobacteria bacterium]|nr:site-specific integrase [Gammaproteobacteria bacterium]
MLDMYAQTHLFKRNSTYYFRARIPSDLRGYLGKSEEKFSLKTKDQATARRLARQASVDFDCRCQRLRDDLQTSQGSKTTRVIDDSLIQEVCDLWRHYTLSGDEYSRREGLFSEELEERAEERRATRELLRETLRKCQLESIEPAMQVFLHMIGVELTGEQQQYRSLLYRFLQTATEVHEQQIARDAGEVVWTPQAPSNTTINSSTQVELSLEELFEDWQRFDPNRPKRTVDDVRRVIDDFQRLVGNKDVSCIDRQDIIRYRDDLIGRGLRSKTVNKKITFLCALFNVGINSGKLVVNPAQRVPVPKNDSRHRLPFDRVDLNRIFESPLYTHGQRLGRRVGEASVWIPLLALYQGCRVEELGQLLVEDVQRIDGIYCLVIDDMPGENGQEKRLKNTASRRRLPLHPELVKAGFLLYVEQVKTQGKEKLFPTLRPDRFGKFSAAFSKAFMKYLRKDLEITDPCKVFHSFRHNFRDACREAGLDEEISDALMGHSNTQKMGRRYGTSFSLQRLNEAICKIEYPDLNVPVIINAEA